MSKKQRKFADDGWAVWVEGDDTSTIYINDWINPKGNSYVDFAVRIRGIKISKSLHVYVPFDMSPEEIDDVSLRFEDTKLLQATFSAACIVDYKKNAYTSEIAYNGKTIDIVHISTLDYRTKRLSSGTLISVDLEKLYPYIENDEAYFVWRMPHKTLDAIFKHHVDVGNSLDRLRDLITTPVVSEKYGYSIRINEARLLPEEITRISSFHRQKLKKAVIAIAIDESYEMNDAGCYRIRRLEENVYKDYLPANYNSEDVLVYQWNQDRDHNNLRGQFNFYYSISKEAVSKSSMFLYMILLFALTVFGELISQVVLSLLGL